MIRKKSWIWWFTIFANPNVTTTLYPNIYLGKNYYNSNLKIKQRILKHEEIHLKQQQKFGKNKYLLCYIFLLPFFYNKYRFNWEYEAYANSGTSKEKTLEYLKTWNYGWLMNKFNK